jgi:AbrB family looped-hinge helix DNA binding protein
MKLIDKNMKMKTVRISDKGQIAIPMDIRNSLGLRRGDELVLIQTNNKILIEKQKKMIKRVKEDFKDMITLTESSLKKLWLNKEDEIWNEYLKKGKK